MVTPADRVRAFLDAREKMGGPLDKAIIARLGIDGDTFDLTVADLRELVGPAPLDRDEPCPDCPHPISQHTDVGCLARIDVEVFCSCRRPGTATG